MTRRSFAGTLAVLTWASLMLAPGISFSQVPPLPPHGPSPLLYVRFVSPLGMQPDQPLETEVGRGQDPVGVAREFGRPLLIVRLGGRILDREDLVRQGIPGTVLVPDTKSLPRPPLRPFFPVECAQVFDTFL